MSQKDILKEENKSPFSTMEGTWEENKILKENVKDLQGQLQNSYKKNKELEDKNHQKVVILEKLLEGISDGKLQTKVKEN